MRKKLLFCFCFTLLTVTVAAAQGRRVTNADLQKYRDARIAAEKDLRENYEKLGFPSPEEFERRREENRIETTELIDKLREDRIERERLDASRSAVSYSGFSGGGNGQYGPYWSGGSYGGFFGGGGGYYQSRRRGYQQNGYYAGGQFWPSGPATRPRPLFARPRIRIR